MKLTRLLFSVLLFAILFSCSKSREVSSSKKNAVTGINADVLADLIMQRMDLQPGEKVLLVAEPGRFDPLVAELEQSISEGPGEYLGCISVSESQPSPWLTPFVEGATGLDDEALKQYLQKADIGIMLPGASPSDRVYGLMQDNLKDSIGRTIHFHWSGAYGLDGDLLEMTPEIDSFYQASLLNTNYEQLAADQQRLEEAMRGQVIRVTTPAGTDISFEIGGRPVTKQNGDASAATASRARNLIDREMELPAGAIRVAPMETTVQGTIAFPDMVVNQDTVKSLVMTFKEGRAMQITAVSGLERVDKVIARVGDAARSFREFALGFNPTLAIPEDNPWIPYYGYGSGVVRLSLGDNSELGGNVDGGYVKWNFFTDATVMVGDEVWVKDGKMVDFKR